MACILFYVCITPDQNFGPLVIITIQANEILALLDFFPKFAAGAMEMEQKAAAAAAAAAAADI